jgi:DNA-binding beta-propeller fold protein YncE
VRLARRFENVLGSFSGLIRGLTLLALAGSTAGCGIGESGVAPPSDRIFLPSGLLADPSGKWLYVVNSNSDLRFNAGTLAVVDLDAAKRDRSNADWPVCPANRFVPPANTQLPFCCRDPLDRALLNCDERAYVLKDATVRIGSFGGAMTQQTFERAGQTVRRLFVAVRAEPSITFVDATFELGTVQLRCSGAHDGTGTSTANTFCEDEWRLTKVAGQGGPDVDLPEEPHSLILDDKLGVLYVGHLGATTRTVTSLGGVSTVDVCAPAMGPPRLAAVNKDIFPGAAFQGVSSIALPEAGNPDQPLYATARLSPEVRQLRLREGAAVSCSGAQPQQPRDLTLIGAEGFLSSAFYPNGFDIRGFALSDDRQQGFVLHRNNDVSVGSLNTSRLDPSALVVLDRRPDERGQPLNTPTNIVEVCTGPTSMVQHDAGRGQRFFITCFEGGQIYVVDPKLPAVTGIVDVGRGPSTIVFSATDPGLAFVTTFADNSVAVLDLTPGSPTENRVVQRIGFPRSEQP